MNKLTNIYIASRDYTITFIILVDNPINEEEFILCVDECYNLSNIYEDDVRLHTYIFTPKNSTITFEKLSEDENVYEVTITRGIIEDFDLHIKYFRAITGEDNFIVDAIYYNSSVIYKSELSHLNTYCCSCLDDKQMLLIMYITFKRQLLESSIKLLEANIAFLLYADICRALKINLPSVYPQGDICIVTEDNECLKTESGNCFK